MPDPITTPGPWLVPSDQPQLAPDVVHVWRLALDLAETEVSILRAGLPPDEEARAARFHSDKHRRRFIACRGQVRRILTGYLGGNPAEISFQYGIKGKPSLAAPGSDSPIQFNVSNSHERALCAVCLNRDLGVDLEYVHRPTDIDGLAERFFTQREVDTLRSLPGEQRTQAFFNCWTRKEAVLKAVGIGLGMPLNQVEVTLAPQDPARVVVFADDAATALPWQLHNLAPAPDYVGALAYRGAPLEVKCWQQHPFV